MFKNKFYPSLILAVLIAGFTFISCNSKSGGSAGNADLQTDIDSVSYSLGYQNGNFLRQKGMDNINLDLLEAGIKDAFNENDAMLSDQQMRSVVQKYQVKAQARAMKKREEDAKTNLKKGQDFLAENKNKPGVKTTDSGLQYKVLKEGNGPSPEETDTVTVNYEGTLIDGTVFDSSYERKEPATFPLNRVIKGWTEGLQLMKEGAVYKFFIPAELAYGKNPRPGGPIGPNETLIFKVELLKVK